MSSVILFEWDKPLDFNDWLNYEAGIWFFTVTPGVVTVTDDHSNTGYYTYQNEIYYNVKSLRVDDLYFQPTASLADCRLTNQSFYYDGATSNLYVHFNNFNPPLYNIGIWIGIATGLIFGEPTTANKTDGEYYFNNAYYDPRLKSIGPIKQNKDPIFFGKLTFNQSNIVIENSDGGFDDWRTRGLFNQPARVLVGESDAAYSNYSLVGTGYISNDSRTFSTLTISMQDPRKGLTQAVARNLLNQTDWPDMSDSNVDKPKPVAYGKRFNAEALCLSENGSSPFTFLICDTEFNAVSSLDTVYFNGASVSPGNVDLVAGTFTLTSAQIGTDFSSVTIDFTMPITNGVDIITDMMENYEGLPLVSSFWNISEISAASLISRNTSIYINDNKKLSDAIGDICNDIDGIFYNQRTGLYTIRIYDVNRTPTKTLYRDEWLGDPSISNNGEEFLTSAIIKYKKNESSGNYTQTENKDYELASFLTYKKYKNKSFNTGLYTLAEATAKADTILQINSNVQDIITRQTIFDNRDIELMDFIVCDPESRDADPEVLAVYEVLGISVDSIKEIVDLTLRYIRPWVPIEYNVRVASTGAVRVTSTGAVRITKYGGR